MESEEKSRKISIYKEILIHDQSFIHLPRQLEWKVVGMLDLQGLREILGQEITIIQHEGEDCAIVVEKIQSTEWEMLDEFFAY